MDINERIRQLKLESQDHEQVTVRISAQHERMVLARIKKHDVKKGQYLRVLLEDAIERESKAEPIPYKKSVALFSKEEFDALKKEVKQLKKKMNDLDKSPADD